jgi:hypothetical protein
VACNHFVPLWRERGPINTTRAQLKHDLSILAPLIHAEKWGALGGEPTLHKDLVALLNIARDSGVATETEVWTNGAFLRRMSDEFWESFDILVLSVYPGQHTESQMDWIRERCHQAKVTLDLKDEVHRPNFRTILEPTPTSHDVTKQKFDACFFRKFSRNASFGFFFTCCCGPHIPTLIQGKTVGVDGIPITEDLTEADIRRYLERSEPLGACTVCAGRATAVPIPWREERQPLQWLTASGQAYNPPV